MVKNRTASPVMALTSTVFAGSSSLQPISSGTEDPIAETLFNRAAGPLSECLEADWHTDQGSQTRDGRPAGEHLRFTNRDASAPSVSLYRIKDESRQSLYLYTGTRARSPKSIN